MPGERRSDSIVRMVRFRGLSTCSALLYTVRAGKSGRTRLSYINNANSARHEKLYRDDRPAYLLVPILYIGQSRRSAALAYLCTHTYMRFPFISLESVFFRPFMGTRGECANSIVSARLGRRES